MTAMEAVLTEALEGARVRGELAGERSPVEPARFLTTFIIQGLHVMGQAHADQALLKPAVAGALRVLDRAPRARGALAVNRRCADWTPERQGPA
ncbi:hypothetical protein ACE1SV_69330 [Streptomyces sp. E-15]